MQYLSKKRRENVEILKCLITHFEETLFFAKKIIFFRTLTTILEDVEQRMIRVNLAFATNWIYLIQGEQRKGIICRGTRNLFAKSPERNSEPLSHGAVLFLLNEVAVLAKYVFSLVEKRKKWLKKIKHDDVRPDWFSY